MRNDNNICVEGGTHDGSGYWRPINYNSTHTANSIEVLIESNLNNAGAHDEAFAVNII